MQHISGRVTRDATIKQLEDGRQFISFSIADNDSYKPKDSDEWVDQTTFFSCTYWPLKTEIAKVLRKGATVDLIGRTYANPYKDKNGNWTAGLNFNATRIHFTHYAPKPEAEEGQQQTTAASTDKANSRKANSNAKTGTVSKDSDDLPF